MMRRVASVLTAFFCLAEAATAQTLITRPQWVQRPDASDVEAAYSPEAMRRKQGGRALLHCAITSEGRLTACTVANETPPGLGIGAASLLLAPKFRMAPIDLEGHPVAGGVIQLPIELPKP